MEIMSGSHEDFDDDEFGPWIDACNVQLVPHTELLDHLLNSAVKHYNSCGTKKIHSPHLLKYHAHGKSRPYSYCITFAAYEDGDFSTVHHDDVATVHRDKPLGVYQAKVRGKTPTTDVSHVNLCRRKASVPCRVVEPPKVDPQEGIQLLNQARRVIGEIQEFIPESRDEEFDDDEFGPWLDASTIQIESPEDHIIYLLDSAVEHYNQNNSHRIWKPRLLKVEISLDGDPLWLYLTFAANSDDDVASLDHGYQAKVTRTFPVTEGSYVHLCRRKGVYVVVSSPEK